MNLDSVRRWMRRWQRRRQTSSDVLSQVIPAFAQALEAEGDAKGKRHTQGINRAREAKRRALIHALAGGKPKIRVKARKKLEVS